MPHGTFESSHLPARPLHVEFDFLIFWIKLMTHCVVYIPGGPVGPPVARSADIPLALGVENTKWTSPAQVEPAAARVWPKLLPPAGAAIRYHFCL